MALRWTWRDVGQWTDTEGTLGCKWRTTTVKGRTFTARDCHLEISQKAAERPVLEDLCNFINQELGPKSCRIATRGTRHPEALLRITRIDTIRQIIPKIKPYIRTQTKKRQIQEAEHILL